MQKGLGNMLVELTTVLKEKLDTQACTRILLLCMHFKEYSRSLKVGNPIASILKSNAQGIPALVVLNPVSKVLGPAIPCSCSRLSILEASMLKGVFRQLHSKYLHSVLTKALHRNPSLKP